MRTEAESGLTKEGADSAAGDVQLKEGPGRPKSEQGGVMKE